VFGRSACLFESVLGAHMSPRASDSLRTGRRLEVIYYRSVAPCKFKGHQTATTSLDDDSWVETSPTPPMAPPPPPQVAHRHRRRGMSSASDSATHQPRNLRRANRLELHIRTIPYADLSLSVSLSGVHTASANPRGARVCCSTFACCVSHLHACSAANFIS